MHVRPSPHPMAQEIERGGETLGHSLNTPHFRTLPGHFGPEGRKTLVADRGDRKRRLFGAKKSGTFTVRLADLLGPKWLFRAKVGFVCFAECFAKRCSQPHFGTHPIAGNGHKIDSSCLSLWAHNWFFVARLCKH